MNVNMKKIISGVLVCGLATMTTAFADSANYKLQLFFNPGIMNDVTGEILTDINVKNVDLAISDSAGAITKLELEYKYDDTAFDILKNDDDSVNVIVDNTTLVSDKSKLTVTAENGTVHIVCNENIDFDGTLCRVTLVSKNVSALWNSFDTYPLRFKENSIRVITENDGEFNDVEGIDGRVGAYNTPQNTDDVSVSKRVTFTVGSSEVTVDGQKLNMDAVPYTDGENLMIPIRYYAEYIGMEVEWDGEKCIASAYGKNKTIKASVSDGIYINSVLCDSELKPEIKDERMYIPVSTVKQQYPKAEFQSDGDSLSIFIP